MSGSGAEIEVPHGDNDPFTKKVAFSVALFAVVLAVAAAGGKSAGKDMLTNQLDASNKWSQYQAKVMREVMYTQEREALEQSIGILSESDITRLGSDYEAIYIKKTKPGPAENSERQKLRLAYISGKLAEYTKEKEELRSKAESYENARKLAHRKDGYFDYAELALQFAILLASISMLTKARWPVMFSVGLAIIGTTLTLGGYIIPEKAPNVHIPLIDPDQHEEKH